MDNRVFCAKCSQILRHGKMLQPLATLLDHRKIKDFSYFRVKVGRQPYPKIAVQYGCTGLRNGTDA